jgi:hypothetical protein
MRIAAILLAICCSVAPVWADTPLLKATVSHSDRLPPIPPMMRKGSPVQNIRIEKSDDLWYPIPEALAGTWHIEKVHAKLLGIPISMECVGDQTFGTIRDSDGQVWHRQPLPQVMKRESGFDDLFIIVTHNEPIEQVGSKLLRRTVEIQARNNLRNPLYIAQVHQLEAFDEYEIVGNSLYVDGTFQRYSEDGKRGRSYRAWCTKTRIKPFEQDDDALPSFRSWCATHGLAHLAP